MHGIVHTKKAREKPLSAMQVCKPKSGKRYRCQHERDPHLFLLYHPTRFMMVFLFSRLINTLLGPMYYYPLANPPHWTSMVPLLRVQLNSLGHVYCSHTDLSDSQSGQSTSIPIRHLFFSLTSGNWSTASIRSLYPRIFISHLYTAFILVFQLRTFNWCSRYIHDSFKLENYI